MKILLLYILLLAAASAYIILTAGKKEKFYYRGRFFLPRRFLESGAFETQIGRSMKYGRPSSEYKRVRKRSGF